MDDLISRQAAIDALRYAQHRFTVADEAGGMGTVKWSEDVIYFAAAERVLSGLPSAQPERKKGKWHRRFYPQIEMMVCSECQEEFSYDAETGIRDYNYCPNCGAEMEATS